MGEPARSLRRCVAVGAWAIGISGCALTPRSKLEECHKFSQSLQAEVVQLKDVALKLRSHNQDLAQRAIDDEQQLEHDAQRITQLERSVQAYQDERDELAAAFEQLKQQVAAAADPVPMALLDRFEALTHRYPTCTYDASRRALSVPIELLFGSPGTALTPEGRDLLRDCAGLLADPGGAGLTLRVVDRSGTRPDEPDTRPAGYAPSEPSAGDPAGGRAPDRAGRVRAALLGLAGRPIDPDRVVAVAGTPPPSSGGRGAASGPGMRAIVEIRVDAPTASPALRPEPEA